MDCVCGCGREIPKNLGDRNFIAARVALELLAWDKNRALPGPEPEGREGLIARGVECYERLLYSLHGGGGADPDEESREWVEESTATRATRSDMTKKRFLRSTAPNLNEEDMARLDRRHPDRSFTGGRSASRPESAASGDDLVGQLERLRTLLDDEVLTAEEFAAAKARLLERR